MSENVLIDSILELHATVQWVLLIVTDELSHAVKCGGSNSELTTFLTEPAVTNLLISSKGEREGGRERGRERKREREREREGGREEKE